MKAVVPGHGTVCRLSLDRLPVGGHQHRGHEPEGPVALGDRVGLHVAVVVLPLPQLAAVPLEARRYHVVDQAVLVGKFRCVELALELFLENLLEQILETAIVDFENSVFGGEIYRILALQTVVEARAREAADRLVQIEHRQADARARGLEHLALDRRSAARGLERELDRSRAVKLDLGGAVLVPEAVTGDDDRKIPVGNDARNVLADDGRHFVPVHLDDGIFDFDFAHGKLLQFRFERDRRCDLAAIAAAKTTGLPLLIGPYYSQFGGLPRVKEKIDSYLIYNVKRDL